MSEISPVKRPGFKTSEFWLGAAFLVMVVANGTPFVNIPMEQMTMAAVLCFGYGGGRALIKNTVAKKEPT